MNTPIISDALLERMQQLAGSVSPDGQMVLSRLEFEEVVLSLSQAKEKIGSTAMECIALRVAKGLLERKVIYDEERWDKAFEQKLAEIEVLQKQVKKLTPKPDNQFEL